jgi:hypothetical protein
MTVGKRSRFTGGVAVVLAAVALTVSCGNDTTGTTNTPAPTGTRGPSNGTAPAPGFASGTTAPPVRSPVTTARVTETPLTTVPGTGTSTTTTTAPK